LAMARVRLGLDVFAELKRNTRKMRLQNGALADIGGIKRIWTENFSAPLVMNESVIQSYNGLLRLAPVKLKTTVRFANLRAVGAFLVSGEVHPGGRVVYASIHSEAGNDCMLVKPWPGIVRIRTLEDMRPVATIQKDDVICFKTQRGKTYIIDRPDCPWEGSKEACYD